MYHIDKKDTSVEWHTHKMKKQNLMGLPGSVPFTYDRFKARYFDMEGNCPLVPHVANPQQQSHDYARGANMPQSTFEDEVKKAQDEQPIF